MDDAREGVEWQRVQNKGQQLCDKGHGESGKDEQLLGGGTHHEQSDSAGNHCSHVVLHDNAVCKLFVPQDMQPVERNGGEEHDGRAVAEQRIAVVPHAEHVPACEDAAQKIERVARIEHACHFFFFSEGTPIFFFLLRAVSLRPTDSQVDGEIVGAHQRSGSGDERSNRGRGPSFVVGESGPNFETFSIVNLVGYDERFRVVKPFDLHVICVPPGMIGVEGGVSA